MKKVFGNIPAIPFIIFIVFAIAMMFISLPYSGLNKITGGVTNTLSLTEINYGSGVPFEGELNLVLTSGDFIPKDSKVEFTISDFNKIYYMCSNKEPILWHVYNLDLGEYETEEFEPWLICDSDEEETNYSCASKGKKCCSMGGTGNFYYNLNCSGSLICWDKCSTPKTLSLEHAIALSDSPGPGKGNYSSNGTYYNVDNPVVFTPKYGPGFRACEDFGTTSIGNPIRWFISIFQNGITGNFAITPPITIQRPDLIVKRLALSGNGDIYARIKNIGTASSSGCSFKLSWTSTAPCPDKFDPGSGPPGPSPTTSAIDPDPFPDPDPDPDLVYHCDWTYNVGPLAVNQEEIIYIIEIEPGNYFEGKSVTAKVDSGAIITEGNEANNIITRVLKLCFINLNGICEDTEGLPVGYCVGDTQIVYRGSFSCNSYGECTPPMFVGTCPQNYVCQDGLEGGAQCVPGASECEIANGICRPNMLGGSSCQIGEFEDLNLDCPPVIGAPDVCCISSTPVEYTCELVEGGYCSYVDYCYMGGTKTPGLTCPPGQTCCVLDTAKCDDTDGGVFYNINGTCTDSSGVQNDVCLNSTHLKEWNCSGGVCVNEIYLCPNGCNIGYGKCKTDYPSAYSCDGWNNAYKINLTNLFDVNIETPKNVGAYLLGVSLVHNGTIICSNFSEGFYVESPETSGCRWVNLTGWSPAICTQTGKQRKTWKEVNNCTVVESMPPGCILSKSTVPFKCVQEQNCTFKHTSLPLKITDWKPYPCTGKKQWVLYQFQNGTVLNQTRDCCLENWTIRWGACNFTSGIQDGVWIDSNGCDTTYTQPEPAEKTRTCVDPAVTWQKLMVWILITAIVLVAIISIALYAVKKARTKATKTIKEATGGTARAGVPVVIKPMAKPPAQLTKPKPKSILPIKKVEYPGLKNYIAKAKARGMKKETMKRELLKAGWPAGVVNRALG